MDIPDGLFPDLLVGEKQPIVVLEAGRFVRYAVLVPRNYQQGNVKELDEITYENGMGYKARIEGIFQGLLVGLESAQVRIGNKRSIKYFVLEAL